MFSRLPAAASLALLLAATAPAFGSAAPPTAPGTLAVAVRPAAGAVDAFHAALRRGDTAAALGFLADDALVFEEGGVERSKAEYAAQHLAADAAFSQAVPGVVTRRTGRADGKTAWIASEGRSTGSFRGREFDRATVETMILRRTGSGWKIVHIHWSSSEAKPR
jgi:ketosteroid isomerase-like protein